MRVSRSTPRTILALELHALLEGLREGEPDFDAYDLQGRVNEVETVEAAEQEEARTLARFDAAAELRRRVEAYGEALHKYLAGWPEEERSDEEERVRDLVSGSDVGLAWASLAELIGPAANDADQEACRRREEAVHRALDEAGVPRGALSVSGRVYYLIRGALAAATRGACAGRAATRRRAAPGSQRSTRGVGSSHAEEVASA